MSPDLTENIHFKKPNTRKDTFMKRERERRRYLDAMLEAVQLPTGIANLNSSLTDMDRDALSFSLFGWKENVIREKERERKRRHKQTKAFIKTPLDDALRCGRSLCRPHL